ncbi:hypothetical protein HAX54_034278 [Datura stramonium]|uniref:Uncharacterized protein n=1 Tax=Datura stramonium TaxID=4076 RepID=A0ABS8VGU6_DATST|nr:hypothetical protein [Datura stramonium]
MVVGVSPIHVCSEEEFLKDVMQFLILRTASFLKVALLSFRMLFSMPNALTSSTCIGRWFQGVGFMLAMASIERASFSKMRCWKYSKRHYEIYLLEYELAHDDVDGECCLLCHSSAAGDWVNCGICGVGTFCCDRRPGLGAFKDYAKTDGLEQHLSTVQLVTNFKKKLPKTTNGYS